MEATNAETRHEGAGEAAATMTAEQMENIDFARKRGLSKERAADGAGTSKGWNKLLAAGAEGL